MSSARSVTAGLKLWQTVALSALMFTGGSQFAFIGVVGGGGRGPQPGRRPPCWRAQRRTDAAQALIRPPAKLIPLMAQLTIDESTATATAQDDHDERVRGFWTAGFGVYVLWNTSPWSERCGQRDRRSRPLGPDGAAVAAFLGLLWPRLHAKDPIALAVVAALATMLTLPLVPPGIPVLVAAAVTGCWWAWRRRRQREQPA